jgi:ABC-2 type transport system permease protein
VGAATTKSIILGTLILGTALFFVEVKIMHPFVMILMLVLTSLTFSLLGFLIGVLSKNWEELSLFPTIILAPMVFLGGSLYSIKWLPEIWQTVSLINPVLYLVSGFRWSFYELADVSITISLFAIFTFLFLNIVALAYIFKKGYRIKF